MEIIIGREEGARRLHCMVDGREFNIGPAGMVPLSVSRKHCRITINGGHINIENLNLQNETYVDGNQVFSKALTVSAVCSSAKTAFCCPCDKYSSWLMVCQRQWAASLQKKYLLSRYAH